MENKKGQGIFLGVVGVATLVVAIIGATFAYFSASTTGGAGEIQGQTLGGTEGGALQLAVSKISWDETGASSNDLVPTNLSSTTFQNAVTNKCVAEAGEGDTTKYTGCHFYRIVATAGSDIASANLKLTEFKLDNVTVKSDWNYALFETSDAKDATTYTLGNPVSAATGTGEVVKVAGDTNAKAVFSSTAMTKNVSKVYYMLVYVANDGAVQNDGKENDATGSYTGEFTLEAAGGSKAQATFTA